MILIVTDANDTPIPAQSMVALVELSVVLQTS